MRGSALPEYDWEQIDAGDCRADVVMEDNVVEGIAGK
jgi:hypothetical protein